VGTSREAVQEIPPNFQQAVGLQIIIDPFLGPHSIRWQMALFQFWGGQLSQAISITHISTPRSHNKKASQLKTFTVLNSLFKRGFKKWKSKRVKKLGSERFFKWKDGKVFLGRKSYTTLVTYSSEDEYVILTKERRVKNEKEE